MVTQEKMSVTMATQNEILSVTMATQKKMSVTMATQN